jgi:hypothetical protein
MSCFLLSPKTCKQITIATSNYRWSGVANRQGIHWRKWTNLTLPKHEGGLGFRDIKNFNVSMLGKQGWRLMSSLDSLCACVLKGKYFPHGEFMQDASPIGHQPTYGMIVGCLQLLRINPSARIWEQQQTLFLSY